MEIDTFSKTVDLLFFCVATDLTTPLPADFLVAIKDEVLKQH